MKKKLLSLLLLLCAAVCCFAGCDTPSGSSSSSSSSPSGGNPPATVDYVENLKLDMDSETKKQEVEVKLYIDGDTTHFYVPETISANKTLKARYLAVNTPESTGRIEPWGKKASTFTKTKLQSAESIIIETDGTEWEVDSTGDRHLVWVWYKPQGASDYRNLNLEILQNGLAIASSVGDCRYATECTGAINQAKEQKLYVHSAQKDPDFWYGGAQEMTLKELRLNIKQYEGVSVAFEGVATYHYNQGYYIENYDVETDMYYGVYVYLGAGNTAVDQVKPGAHVRVVGKVNEFNGSYQVSGLSYSPFDPEDPSNTFNMEPDKTYPMANLETSAETYLSNKSVAVTDEEDNETIKSFAYTELALHTTLTMKNLTVTQVYTTNNGGKNDGAMTLTCSVGGKTVTVRTMVLKDANDNLITKADLLNKTINVTGIIDYFSLDEDNPEDGYQIKVLEWQYITVLN